MTGPITAWKLRPHATASCAPETCGCAYTQRRTCSSTALALNPDASSDAGARGTKAVATGSGAAGREAMRTGVGLGRVVCIQWMFRWFEHRPKVPRRDTRPGGYALHRPRSAAAPCLFVQQVNTLLDFLQSAAACSTHGKYLHLPRHPARAPRPRRRGCPQLRL